MLSESDDRTLRMSELAARTNASLSRLSHVVSKLEKRGWVARTPVAAQPTGHAGRPDRGRAGRCWWRRRPGHVETVRSLVFDGLTPEDVAALNRVAGHIVDRIEASPPQVHLLRQPTTPQRLSLATPSTIARMVRTLAGIAQAPRGGRLPDFLLVGAPKAGTTALHAALARAPGAVPQPGEGAEVLPVRRLAAAGVPGTGRRAQQPRVDLAAAALPRPVRGRRRRAAGRREHAVLPLPPRRPPPDRRATCRRPGWSPCCATRSTGRTPTGCTCGPTASSRAPTSSRPASGRRSGSTRAGRRSGTTAGWGCTAGRSPTCSSTSRASRCWCCATAQLVDDPRAASTGCRRFLGVAEDVVTEIPSGNSRPFVNPSVRTKMLGPVVRAGAAGRPVPAAAGVAEGEPAADRAAAPARQPRASAAHARAGRGAARSRSSRTSRCWSR